MKGGGAITDELAQVKRLPIEAGAAVSADESVKKLLGEPVTVAKMATENYRNNNGVGEMRFTLPLAGAKQSGMAAVQATRAPPDGWKLRHIQVKAQDGDTVTVLDEREDTAVEQPAQQEPLQQEPVRQEPPAPGK